jgi:glutathione S-transferase
MWQYWELVLAEEIWPLSRQQVDGVIWRMNYSRNSFYSSGPPSQQSDDPFYKEKVSKIYEGTYLTQSQCRRSVIKILSGFQMLENELKTVVSKNGTQELFLINCTLSQADIAVYPRLTKMPQNGIICTAHERRYFPNVIAYFERLKSISIFKHFIVDDEKIWQSGLFPKFVPQWWGSYLPWWAVVLIGKFRSGCFNFQRVTQNSIGDKKIAKLLEDIDKRGLSVIPTAIHRDDIIALVDKGKLLTNTPSTRSPSKGIKEHEHYLFCHQDLPMAAAVRICSRLLGFKCMEVEVDIMHLQHFQDTYLRIMPFGEVPSLVLGDKGIYGPHIIVELMHTMMGSSSSKPQTKGRGIHIHLKGLDELNTVNRAIVRRWFGWVRTTWHYQLQFFYFNAKITRIKKLLTKKEYYDILDQYGSSSPGTEAVEEMKELFKEPKAYKDLEPYKCELIQRLQFLNSELTSDFICGDDPTYADIFLLTTILTIERLVVPLNPVDHMHIINWKNMLLNDSIISGLCDSIII